MTIRLTFHLHLDADYHVTAGQRFGPIVDAALQRDHDGTPLLRGSQLAGLLRQGLVDLQAVAAEEDAVTLLNSDGEAALKRLFGSAARPKRWRFGSARPIATVGHGTRWGGHDVARVALDPRTRRAQDKTLFAEEEGSAALAFAFEVSCSAGDALDRADGLLLVAAARMVRHLGGTRRRGRGACRLELVAAEELDLAQADTGAALKAFRALWLEGKALPEAAAAQEMSLPAAAGSRRRFRLLAYAVDPLLMARRMQAGNAIESVDYIAGTALLGSLAARAARRLRISRPGREAPDAFAELFQRGGIAISNLLPAALREASVVDGMRVYPALTAPFSLVQGETRPVFDGRKPWDQETLHDRLAGDPQMDDSDMRLRPVSGTITVHDDRYRHEQKVRSEMHVQMEDGRALDGQLYEYIVLEAGQWFVGELHCDADQWPAVQELTGLREGEAVRLAVGKGTRRGFGTIVVHVEALPAAAQALNPLPLDLRLGNVDGENDLTFSLLLLTDAIVTDPWQRYYTSFDAAWIAAALGIPPNGVALVQDGQGERQFAKTREVATFNTHRRMPRWRDVALTAGSVARVELKLAALDVLVEKHGGTAREAALAGLQALEERGVGLRRFEGFGRVAVNHVLLNRQAHGEALERELASGETALTLLPEAAGRPETVDKQLADWLRDLAGDGKLHRALAGDNNSAVLALGRLIFLHRHRPVDELRPHLQPDALFNASNLWGDKPLPTRQKEATIDKKTFDLLNAQLDRIAALPAAVNPAALTRLAAIVAEAGE